jgi:hypothetical protein
MVKIFFREKRYFIFGEKSLRANPKRHTKYYLCPEDICEKRSMRSAIRIFFGYRQVVNRLIFAILVSIRPI